jgi:hypothetical protein
MEQATLQSSVLILKLHSDAYLSPCYGLAIPYQEPGKALLHSGIGAEGFALKNVRSLLTIEVKYEG